jgi:hypothetical protein
MVEHLHREVEQVLKAMETQLVRIGQLQQQIDQLRALAKADRKPRYEVQPGPPPGPTD